jgi:hypothetical protein
MEHKMSTFSETITPTNAGDLSAARTRLIPRSKVRSLTVNCVDTGSWFLVINEQTRAALGLAVTGTGTATLAGDTIEKYPVTEPVEFRWKDRKKSMEALLIPDADDVLFGALCMEALDLMADPAGECLVGRHGDQALYKVKGHPLAADSSGVWGHRGAVRKDRIVQEPTNSATATTMVASKRIEFCPSSDYAPSDLQRKSNSYQSGGVMRTATDQSLPGQTIDKCAECIIIENNADYE